MNRIERVVFFSKHDGAGNYMLEKAEKLLNTKPGFSGLDINSLLEFHHIHQYFENGLFLNRWTADQKNAYQETVKLALVEIRRYFLQLNQEHLAKIVEELEFDNRKNFWELFRLYETYKRTDRNILSETLRAHPHHIRYILNFKQLVDYFNNEIRSFLLTYEGTAELLLSHYEENNHPQQSAYIFPQRLTDQDKHNIIEAYLDTEEPNLNYVNLAINSKQLKLSPKILLKAKKKAKSLEEQYFNEKNSIKISVGAALKMDQAEPVIFEKKGTASNATYGGLYLDSLGSDIELFSAFKRLFAYTDGEGLITLINKETEMDNLEKIFIRSKNEYLKGSSFRHKDILSLTQLGIMSHYLNIKQRSIENVIENFIQEYFAGQFNMTGIIFKLPDTNLAPADKIKLMAPEMEYLLKQFKNFVTDGHIDHELLQIDSTPVFFSEIPSLVHKKYITSEHQTIKKLQHYFFDPHGILSHRKGERDDRNLFQILMDEPVPKSTLEDYQDHYIDLIIQEGFLVVNENGEIKMANPVITFIAGQLHENGCLSYWHYSVIVRTQIDRLLREGILDSTSRLFSSQEISYLNYYLNKKEFSDGMNLRNKYLHGSNNRIAEHQKMDYLYFLRTLILILLKLKDDLELNTYQHNN